MPGHQFGFLKEGRQLSWPSKAGSKERDAMVLVDPAASALFLLLPYAENWTQSLSQARQVLLSSRSKSCKQQLPPLFLITFTACVWRAVPQAQVLRSKAVSWLSSTVWVQGSSSDHLLPTPTPVSLYCSWLPPKFAPQGCGLDFLIPVMEYQVPAELSRPWDNRGIWSL